MPNIFNNREAVLERLREGSAWDVLVIGGGATGLGIALDAASRGYQTLLVEQADFAKGTSGRSTKLVHGGVRYLAQGNVRLVREASIERGLLVRNAPHLVKSQSFIVPVYSWWNMLKYTVGLKLYDKIAGRLSLGPSIFISRKETLEKMPGIQEKGLLGSVRYFDGQFDDARLAINLAQTIIEHGGTVINYMKVTGLEKDVAGQLTGASIMDAETNEVIRISARAVVNATGVFVDDILQMDVPGSHKSICVSQGTHLVIDRSFFPSDHALMIPETSDGRVLFAVPWHNKVVVGTTDTEVDEALPEPVALEQEINFILSNLSAFLTVTPGRKDVLSVFAGLRPLAAPQSGAQKTKEISRSHKMSVSASRLFTIVGGKWTTYRKMAEDMVNFLEKELAWPHRKCTTATLPIHGSVIDVPADGPLSYYGSDVAGVKNDAAAIGLTLLSEKLEIYEAQVSWAVRHEMARTVEDFLSRRTRVLLLDARESQRMAPFVAAIMAKELGRSQAWQAEQLQMYLALSDRYLL